MNRVLKDLEASGLVRLGYRRIKVVDPTGLERIASPSGTMTLRSPTLDDGRR